MLLLFIVYRCDKLATVVGRRFITLNVQLCVEHDGRNAARRADLSAAAETCLFPVKQANTQLFNAY